MSFLLPLAIVGGAFYFRKKVLEAQDMNSDSEQEAAPFAEISIKSVRNALNRWKLTSTHPERFGAPYPDTVMPDDGLDQLSALVPEINQRRINDSYKHWDPDIPPSINTRPVIMHVQGDNYRISNPIPISNGGDYNNRRQMTY